jgi:hypothetical protein
MSRRRQETVAATKVCDPRLPAALREWWVDAEPYPASATTCSWLGLGEVALRMAKKKSSATDHRSGGDSRYATTSGARDEAAAIAAAWEARVRPLESALDTTLTHILRAVPVCEEARKGIAEVIAQGSGADG